MDFIDIFSNILLLIAFILFSYNIYKYAKNRIDYNSILDIKKKQENNGLKFQAKYIKTFLLKRKIFIDSIQNEKPDLYSKYYSFINEKKTFSFDDRVELLEEIDFLRITIILSENEEKLNE